VQRLQGPPIDVAVPAGSPEAAGATTIRVPLPSSGMPGGGAGSGPITAVPKPPLPLLVPALPLHPGPYRIQPRQRSLAEMANEQLRRGTKPRDPLAEGMREGSIDDCLHAPEGNPAVGGLLAAPGLAARALSGRCAK
jgi:hypothetical protein